MSQTKIIILSAVIGAIFSAGMVFVYQYFNQPTQNDLIKEFYAIETAVHVSPHSLRQKMSKKDTNSFILVDLRSQEEYEKEHIVGAINIPAYKDPDTSAYDEKERIIAQFNVLPKDKEIIVYCYSAPCMTGRKIGKMLTENDIFVKHLGIGWNEWRYYWSLWNHDGETPTDPDDYRVSGKEQGIPKPVELPQSCSEGEFGC